MDRPASLMSLSRWGNTIAGRVAMRLLVLWKTGRLIAAMAVVGVLVYSITVLIVVAVTGDLGIRCVLGHKVVAVEDEPARWNQIRHPVRRREFQVAEPSGAVWSVWPPAPGDVLESIGRWPVRNYHEYVQALRQVRGAVGDTVELTWREGSETGALRLGQVRVRRPPGQTYVWSLVWFAQEMLVFAVGVLVFWKRPRDESARLFFWLCVVTVGAFMGGYHWTQIVVQPPLIHLFAAFAVFVPILSLHFYLVFPRTNPWFARDRRAVLAILYGLPLGFLVAMWICMIWATRAGAPVQTALGTLGLLAWTYVRFSVLIFVACLACLVFSFVRARDRLERNQVQWILLATLLSFVPISYLLWDCWNDPTRLGLASSAWPMFIVSLLYTMAYATSITRYKLMQAEVLLNRGVLYFLVSLAAGLVYSGSLVLTAFMIGDQFLTVRTSTGAILAGLTTLVILVISEALRHQFQKALDRRFHREKYKFDNAKRKNIHTVGNLVDRSTLGRRLLEAASEVLRLDWGSIYLREADGGPPLLAACLGPVPDERSIAEDNPLLVRLRQVSTFRVPHTLTPPPDRAAVDALIALGGEVALALHAEGELAGFLVLGPKRSGLPYENEELAFLGALGSIAALALRSADIQATLEGLNLELRDKVEKIAEQRRRILVLQNQLAGRGREAPTLTAEDAPASLPGVGAAPAESNDSPAFEAIKGSSRALRRMVDMARKVAASPSAVLIRGESGTGKELLAEAIHKASPREGKPFVKVHCAALSQNLLESELFGHVRGAFTGADRDRIGRFQQADGGTLFLDEIGDINWEVQTKLLRVLQQKEFQKVGSSQTLSVDVRIIAATNQDLEALIRSGRFREDLYYRLNVIPLMTPPLRERREDIFELAVHFLNVHARRSNKVVSLLDESAVEMLMAYDWPGNVRELENVIERAVVLADGPEITLDSLPPEIARPPRRRRKSLGLRAAMPALAGAAKQSEDLEIDDPLREQAEVEPEAEFLAFERRRLIDALQESEGNKASAARLLGMPRSTFFSKLRKHGLA